MLFKIIINFSNPFLFSEGPESLIHHRAFNESNIVQLSGSDTESLPRSPPHSPHSSGSDVKILPNPQFQSKRSRLDDGVVDGDGTSTQHNTAEDDPSLKGISVSDKPDPSVKDKSSPSLSDTPSPSKSIKTLPSESSSPEIMPVPVEGNVVEVDGSKQSVDATHDHPLDATNDSGIVKDDEPETEVMTDGGV